MRNQISRLVLDFGVTREERVAPGRREGGNEIKCETIHCVKSTNNLVRIKSNEHLYLRRFSIEYLVYEL